MKKPHVSIAVVLVVVVLAALYFKKRSEAVEPPGPAPASGIRFA